MKNLINRVQLIGNLGQDIEIKDFSSGSKLARVSLATSEVYTKQGEKHEETSWHRLVAWGKTAEMMSSLCKKGSRLAIQGKLTNREYEDKEGQKRYTTEIVVDEFYLIGKREKSTVPF